MITKHALNFQFSSHGGQVLYDAVLHLPTSHAENAAIKTGPEANTRSFSVAIIAQFAKFIREELTKSLCKVLLGLLLQVARNERTPQVRLSLPCSRLPCSRPRVLSRASRTSASPVLCCSSSQKRAGFS